MSALVNTLKRAMRLGGFWLPLTLFAGPGEVREFAEILVDPDAYRQGLWPALQELIYQSDEQSFILRFDSSTDPRLAEIEQDGYAYWREGFLKIGNAIRADRALRESSGVDFSFIDRAAFRLEDAANARLRPPLISPQRARDMAVVDLGLGGVGPLDEYFKTDLGTASAFRRRTYGLESFEDESLRKSPVFWFEQWRAQEMESASAQIVKLERLIQETWLKNFPGKFFLKPKHLPDSSTAQSLVEIAADQIKNLKFSVGPQDLEPVQVVDERGESYLLYRQTAFGMGEPQAVRSGDRWHLGLFEAGISDAIARPKQTQQIEYLQLHLIDAIRYQNLLNTYQGLRDADGARDFVGKFLESSVQRQSDTPALNEFVRGNFELLYWAGVEANGGDANFLSHREGLAFERGSPHFDSKLVSDFAFASPQKKWRSGVLPPTVSTKNASNSKSVDSIWYTIHAKQSSFAQMPVHFWSVSVDGFLPAALRPVRPNYSFVVDHEIRSQTVMGLEGRYLSIPRATSFDPVWVDLRDASGNWFVLGKDFELYEDPSGEVLFAKFLGAIPRNVCVRAAFSKRRALSPPQLRPHGLEYLDATVVVRLIEDLRTAHLKQTADRLDSLLFDTVGENVSFVAVVQAFKESAFYSYVPELPTPLEQARGPFRAHSKFVNEDLVSCFQCDGAKGLFADFLNEYFKIKGLAYRAVGKGSLSREGDMIVIPGHVITVVYDAQMHEVVTADTTPVFADPRNHFARKVTAAVGARSLRQELLDKVADQLIQINHIFANRVGIRGAERPSDYVTRTMGLLRAMESHVATSGVDPWAQKQRAEAADLLARLDALETYLKTHNKVSVDMEKFKLPGAISTLRRALEYAAKFDVTDHPGLRCPNLINRVGG